MKAYCRPNYDAGTLWYDVETYKYWDRLRGYKQVSRIVNKGVRCGKKRARRLAKKLIQQELLIYGDAH